MTTHSIYCFCVSYLTFLLSHLKCYSSPVLGLDENGTSYKKKKMAEECRRGQVNVFMFAAVFAPFVVFLFVYLVSICLL